MSKVIIILAVALAAMLGILFVASIQAASIKNIGTASGVLFQNGSRPLTANWNGGSFNITASWFKGSLSWSSLVGVPSSFPPSSHSHTLSSVNITDWATGMDWSYVQNKPLTFPSSNHSHSLSFANISDFSTYFNQHLKDIDTPTFSSLILTSSTNTLINIHGTGDLGITYYNGATYRANFLYDVINNNFRFTFNGMTKLVLSSNGTITTGTINYANILDKPSSFTPSTHSHTLSSANISNWASYINQAVLTSSNPSFAGLTLSNDLVPSSDITIGIGHLNARFYNLDGKYFYGYQYFITNSSGGGGLQIPKSKSGIAYTTTGGTVSHGLGETPDTFIASSTEVNYYVTIYDWNSVTFTVNIKHWTGTTFEEASGSHYFSWYVSKTP